jgi:hypothetical protein
MSLTATKTTQTISVEHEIKLELECSWVMNNANVELKTNIPEISLSRIRHDVSVNPDYGNRDLEALSSHSTLTRLISCEDLHTFKCCESSKSYRDRL